MKEINIPLTAVPNPQPERQPAPDGWADAYRETMETLWQAVSDDGTDAGRVLQSHEIIALVQFAAEIREGIAANLISAGSASARLVPLLGATRDEQPAICTCIDFAHARGVHPACEHSRPSCPRAGSPGRPVAGAGSGLLSSPATSTNAGRTPDGATRPAQPRTRAPAAPLSAVGLASQATPTTH